MSAALTLSQRLSFRADASDEACRTDDADIMREADEALAAKDAEIERLKAALTEKRRDRIGDSEKAGAYLCRAETAEAEIAHLREALTKSTIERVRSLIDWLDEHEENASLLIASLTEKQIEDARAALKEKADA